MNGGVAYILSKVSRSPTAGVVTLTEGEAADLVAGKFYIAAMSKKSPRLSARANLAPPPGNATRTSRRSELKRRLSGLHQEFVTPGSVRLG